MPPFISTIPQGHTASIGNTVINIKATMHGARWVLVGNISQVIQMSNHYPAHLKLI